MKMCCCTRDVKIATHSSKSTFRSELSCCTYSLAVARIFVLLWDQKFNWVDLILACLEWTFATMLGIWSERHYRLLFVKILLLDVDLLTVLGEGKAGKGSHWPTVAPFYLCRPSAPEPWPLLHMLVLFYKRFSFSTTLGKYLSSALWLT